MRILACLGARLNDSRNTCIKCQSVVDSAIVDGVCETCRSQAGDTSIDASVPLLIPPATVDLHARPIATDDPHLIPTIKSDESLPESGVRPKAYKPDPIPGIQLQDIIGTGGSATVYRGIQTGANRECAVKFVNRSTHSSAGDRLGREVRAIASLDHPNIVRVFSCDLEGPTPFLVMEYAPGGSLAERLKANPQGLPIAEIVALVENVTRGIAHAHEHGIVHRDLKPGNLLLGSDGTVKVSDFGLARNFETDPTITKSQAILGTPAYMSPEQARSEEATRQSDVYGIGAVLYDCLTGRPPFPTRDYVETLTKVRDEPPPPPRSIRRDVPRDLEAICLRCLEKNPARRYASATELADDLVRFRKGERTQARPVSLPATFWRMVRKHSRAWATAAVVLIAILAASAAWPDRDESRRQEFAALPEGAPDQPQRKATQQDVRRTLEAGKPFELIDELDARVEPYSLMQAAEFRPQSGMKEWTARGIYETGFGLVKDPGVDRYTITGEICQTMRVSNFPDSINKSNPFNERVGLILGHESVSEGLDTVHYFACLNFSEYEEGIPLEQIDPKTKRMGLHSLNYILNVNHVGGLSTYGGKVRPLLPPNANTPNWRPLHVNVSPEGIEFLHDGVKSLLSAQEIDEARKHQHRRRNENLPPGPMRYTPRPWSPRMGIGIWVAYCNISVRNLVITPQPK